MRYRTPSSTMRGRRLTPISLEACSALRSCVAATRALARTGPCRRSGSAFTAALIDSLPIQDHATVPRASVTSRSPTRGAAHPALPRSRQRAAPRPRGPPRRASRARGGPPSVLAREARTGRGARRSCEHDIRRGREHQHRCGAENARGRVRGARVRGGTPRHGAARPRASTPSRVLARAHPPRVLARAHPPRVLARAPPPRRVPHAAGHVTEQRPTWAAWPRGCCRPLASTGRSRPSACRRPSSSGSPRRCPGGPPARACRWGRRS